MRKACWLITICIILQLACQTTVQIESSVDLSGIWQFRFDPLSIGESEGWSQPTDSGEWPTIQVPGSYNALFPDSAWFQGRGWYRTEFNVPEDWSDGRIALKFLGITIRGKVWMNGEFIGKHLFPYIGFEFDITNKIKRTDRNVLVVMVDNEILDKAIPDKNWSDWWNYGGINRQVYLEYHPNLSIADIEITTTMSKTDKWELNLSLQVQNFSKPSTGRLKLVVFDSNGKKKWQTGQRGEFSSGSSRYEFTAELDGIAPWIPETPNLYELNVLLQGGEGNGHSQNIRFGFRQIEVRGTEIFLNGKAIQLRGISRHEFWPSTGTTVSELRTRLDLQDIKTLGCNLVRLTHSSQHPSVYDLCDEMGLLIWDEIPAWKTSVDVLADSQVFINYAQPQLREMIMEHRNHPSVIVWSVGNEFKSNMQKATEYVRHATEFVRSIDKTRLVTFASDQHLNDICFEFVDVIAINEYCGWDYGTIHDIGPLLDSLHTKWPDKPILVSGIGCSSVIGWHNPNPGEKGRDYSEDFQIKFLTTHLHQIYDINRSNYVAGAILWLYNDFNDPHAIGKDHPALCNYVNCNGLVTRDRQKKRAFEEVKKLFSNL